MIAAEPTALEVALVAAPSPLVLIDAAFLRSLAEVEARVATLKVTDGDSAQTAADLQRRLTTAASKLEAARTELKAPFLEQGRKIDAAAKAPADRIAAAKRVVQGQLTAFALAEQKRLEELEKQRQAELRRLEEIKRKEEAEAARIAAELTAKATPEQVAAAEDEGFGDVEIPKSETEKQIEAVKFAPAPVAAKPVGISMRVTLRLEVVDVAALPEAFVIRSANEKALRATFCQPWKDGAPLPVCSGCKFTVDRLPVTTGSRF